MKVIDSLEEALKDADIVVTVTMATEPVVCGRWVKPGAVVCSKLQLGKKKKNIFLATIIQ